MRQRLMVSMVLSAAAVLAGGRAEAQGIEWVRETLRGTSFTVEYPRRGPVIMRGDTEDGSPTWKGLKPEDSYGWGRDFTLQDFGENMPWRDMIRVAYFKNAKSFKSGMDEVRTRMTEPWGEPKSAKRWGYQVLEAAWQYTDPLFKTGKKKRTIAYVVDTAPGEYIIIELSCFADEFDQYAPLYARLRDSLKAPSRRKAR
jgi:hypothetical protein